ncbi:BIR repeat, partial [Trinorchestia longiramus]
MEKFHTLKCLQQEAVRLKTFRGWSKTSIKAEELAKCGFYYLHYLDYTQCFFCRGVVGCWEASDVPQVEHERHFPNCPFVKSPDATGNIPMDSSPLSNLMEEFLNYKLEYHKPPFPKLT